MKRVCKMMSNVYKCQSVVHQLPHCLHPRVRSALTAPVAMRIAIVGTMGIMLDAPLLPLLVLPSFWRSAPVFPFDVSRAVWSIVAVLPFFVTAVVEKVCVVDGDTSWSAPDVRKTSATDGAGTWIAQVPALWSHCTVETVSLPWRRPSTIK